MQRNFFRSLILMTLSLEQNIERGQSRKSNNTSGFVKPQLWVQNLVPLAPAWEPKVRGVGKDEFTVKTRELQMKLTYSFTMPVPGTFGAG